MQTLGYVHAIGSMALGYSYFERHGVLELVGCCSLDCAAPQTAQSSALRREHRALLPSIVLMGRRAVCQMFPRSWWGHRVLLLLPSACCTYSGTETAAELSTFWSLLSPNDQDVLCPQTMKRLQQDPRHAGKFPEVSCHWTVSPREVRQAGLTSR